MKICFLPCLILLAAFSQTSPVSSPGIPMAADTGCSLFGKVDLGEVSASDCAILGAASVDYCAVLVGRPPIHAKRDTSFRRMHNGATPRYVGDGYSLLEVRGVRFIGGVPVGVHGPVLTFDEHLSQGGLEISQLSFVGVPAKH